MFKWLYRNTIHKISHLLGWNLIGPCQSYTKNNIIYVYCKCVYCDKETEHSEVPKHIYEEAVTRKGLELIKANLREQSFVRKILEKGND